MNLFDPRTYSVDWEVMVVNRLDRCVGNEKLLGFAGALRAEFDLPIQTDWNTLEFALGINSTFGQFWDRVRRVTDRASQMVREFDLDLFPSGAHPVDGHWSEGLFNGSHIHVGTIHDDTAGIHLQNQMMKYVPVFGALAANSAASHGLRGRFKSYRIGQITDWTTFPSEARDPRTAQPTWGNDAAPKIYGAPTVEVRITDSASSRRLLAELATFVAAYLHHRGTKVQEYQVSASEYKQYLTNRWAAARHGMQATFAWDGGAKPVAELVDEMLDECGAELKALGASRSDFTVLDAMIKKRICQADFVLSFADRYPDRFLLTSAYAKLVRHWEVFEQYLESAAALEPMPPVDEEAVMAEHLAFVGEGTHFYRLREAMAYPAPVADEIMERLIRERRIRQEVTPNRGMVLDRTD